MNTPLHELWEKLLPPERRWLGWLVVAAALAHAALFFLLKTPPPAAPAPREPLRQAAMLAFSGAQAWLDWRDPSVTILPRNLPPPLTFAPPRYAPAASRAAAVPALPDTLTLRNKLPSIVEQVRDTLTAFRPVPGEVQIETPPTLSGTVVELGGALAGRELVGKTDLPQPEVDRSLRVTICLLAVAADGRVENVLVNFSSEDTAVDQLAARELRRWRFAPANGLQWGTATIYWHSKGKGGAS